jgi:hypothetical protein
MILFILLTSMCSQPHNSILEQNGAWKEKIMDWVGGGSRIGELQHRIKVNDFNNDHL